MPKPGGVAGCSSPPSMHVLASSSCMRVVRPAARRSGRGSTTTPRLPRLLARPIARSPGGVLDVTLPGGGKKKRRPEGDAPRGRALLRSRWQSAEGPEERRGDCNRLLEERTPNPRARSRWRSRENEAGRFATSSRRESNRGEAPSAAPGIPPAEDKRESARLSEVGPPRGRSGAASAGSWGGPARPRRRGDVEWTSEPAHLRGKGRAVKGKGPERAPTLVVLSEGGGSLCCLRCARGTRGRFIVANRG